MVLGQAVGEVFEVWMNNDTFMEILDTIQPDGGVEADAIHVRFGLDAIRRGVDRAEVAQTPSGAAPDALVLEDVAAQAGAG